MIELDAPLIATRTLLPGLQHLVLGAPTLAQGARAGQFVAIRAAADGSVDPLLPVAVALAGIDATAGTVTLQIDDPQQRPLAERPLGANYRLLGPLGHGWPLDTQARNLLLIGTVTTAGSLLALCEVALLRRLNVTLVLGGAIGPAFPPTSIPAAVEYHGGRGPDPALAALELVDDALLRWADTIYTTLPAAQWASLGSRIERTRMRWDRGLAYAATLPALPCAVGVCGACRISVGRASSLICTDGPVFDLRDVARTQ